MRKHGTVSTWKDDRGFGFIEPSVGGKQVFVMSGILPNYVLWWLLGVSVMSFVMYAKDKAAAKKSSQRTPESTLHTLALVGGWPGALFAQELLRHKSRKKSFRTVFWVTVFLNVVALIYLASDYGIWLFDILENLLGQIGVGEQW